MSLGTPRPSRWQVWVCIATFNAMDFRDPALDGTFDELSADGEQELTARAMFPVLPEHSGREQLLVAGSAVDWGAEASRRQFEPWQLVAQSCPNREGQGYAYRKSFELERRSSLAGQK